MRKYEGRSLKYRGQTPPCPEALVLRTSSFVLPTTSFILPLGPIAQRLEPPAHNRPVPGSNPGGPTFAHAWPLERELQWASPRDSIRRSAEREGGREHPRE